MGTLPLSSHTFPRSFIPSLGLGFPSTKCVACVLWTLLFSFSH